MLNSSIYCGNAPTGKINMPGTVVWHELAYVRIIKPSYSAKHSGCIHTANWEWPLFCVYNTLTVLRNYLSEKAVWRGQNHARDSANNLTAQMTKFQTWSIRSLLLLV